MKKFHYRFQALLKAREHAEKERQKQYAAILRRIRDEEQVLERIAERRRQVLDRQRRRMTGTISLAEALIYSRYLLTIRRQTLAGRELLKGLGQSEKDGRQRLLAASQERKKYEKLKERLQERFQHSARRQLANEANEIALNSYRLKQR